MAGHSPLSIFIVCYLLIKVVELAVVAPPSRDFVWFIKTVIYVISLVLVMLICAGVVTIGIG